MKKLIFFLICALPFVGLGAGLTGTYQVSGFDPVFNVHYTGSVIIAKQAAVYTLNWTFDDGTHDIGTGLHVEDELSVVFQNVENPSVNGVQVYKIKHDHRLEGPWVDLGDTRVGTEKIKKVDHSSCH